MQIATDAMGRVYPTGIPQLGDSWGGDPTQDPNANLSVKEYTLQNGVRVWASYQCPPCNEAIKRLQAQLNRVAGKIGARTTSVDGLIGPGTVALAQGVANAALQRGIALQGGILRAAAVSAEKLARKAHVAADVAGQIADLIGAPTKPPQPAPPPAPPVVTPTPVPGQPPPLPPELYANASPGIFGKKSLPWVIGGSILAIGLGVATYLVWKKD